MRQELRGDLNLFAMCDVLDGGRLDGVAATDSLAIDHILQDAFGPCCGTGFARFRQRGYNCVVGVGVGLQIVVACKVLGLHLVEQLLRPNGRSSVAALRPRIDASRVLTIEAQTRERLLGPFQYN